MSAYPPPPSARVIRAHRLTMALREVAVILTMTAGFAVGTLL